MLFTTRTHDGQPQGCILVYNGARAHEHRAPYSDLRRYHKKLALPGSGRARAAYNTSCYGCASSQVTVCGPQLTTGRSLAELPPDLPPLDVVADAPLDESCGVPSPSVFSFFPGGGGVFICATAALARGSIGSKVK